jgi:hypothetical protein
LSKIFTVDEDELMVDLDNKSEVLDYGENDDLEANKEENSRDTAENDRDSEVIKKEGESTLAAVAAEIALEEDEFQVLDEEASDIVCSVPFHLSFQNIFII